MSGIFHYVVISLWTLMSTASVALSVFVIRWAQKEHSESELDLATLYELGYDEMPEKQPKMLLAEEEVGQAKKLCWVQYLFCVHQTLFLTVGILAFAFPTFNDLTDYELVPGVISPILLVVAQLLIVAGQAFVASLIFAKGRVREAWRERSNER